MFPYTREIKVSGCNHSLSEWYPAYRDTRTCKCTQLNITDKFLGTNQPGINL